MLAYRPGASGRNGAPKQVLNVAFGSVTPFSVPATFAVYPERKWYMAPWGVSRAIGGKTPKASAVNITIFRGWPPRPDGTAFSMNEIGYAARVFSVYRSSSRSRARVTGSNTTFSSTVPNRRVVA